MSEVNLYCSREQNYDLWVKVQGGRFPMIVRKNFVTVKWTAFQK